MFAAIPLLFGAQQAAEGVVWTTLSSPDGATHRIAVKAFLAFALAVWPTWVPVSLLVGEPVGARRRALFAISCVGALASAVALFQLARVQPIAAVAGHSLHYEYMFGGGPTHMGILLAAYVIPTVAAFFVSSMALAQTVGLAFAAALALAYVVQRHAFTSVWCVFAAMLSVLMIAAVRREARSRNAHAEIAGH
jgi:hypothetical protein